MEGKGHLRLREPVSKTMEKEEWDVFGGYNC